MLGDTYDNLLVHLSIIKIQHSLRLVTSSELDDKIWDLENILKYFEKYLFHCMLLSCHVRVSE